VPSDPDAMPNAPPEKPGASPEEVAPEHYEATRQQLITEACAPFDKPKLRATLETLKRETEQALDIYTPTKCSARASMQPPRPKPRPRPGLP